MTDASSDVFISYKAEDRKRLIPLVEALEAEGFDVWWDQHIGGGTNWREEIESHLDAAKVVIVVWSKRTIGPEGRFVRDEASQAQEAGHYLPITVDNVRPPLGFREVQALDLSNWWGKRDDARFEVLADTIRRRLVGKEISRKALALPRQGPRLDRRTAIAGGAGIAAVAAAGGFFLLRPGTANANAVAVLPFANLSGDPAQAYFSDGLAEEVRSALSRINGLKVIGRTSSEVLRNDDATTAAQRLDVGSVVTGSVRRSPSMVRVSAQLVDGRDGTEKWSQTFDRPTGDVLAIQTSIAEAVAEQLRSRLGAADRAAMTAGGTKNAAAQDLVLKAEANLDGSKEGFQTKLALYDAAIALDPDYAVAYAGKATQATNLVSYYASSAEEFESGLNAAAVFAHKAIALAPGLSEGHFALGYNRNSALDFATGWAAYRRAIEIPGCSTRNLVNAANFLGQIGRSKEATELWNRAYARDPLDPSVARSKAYLMVLAGNYREAIPLIEKLLAETPTLTQARNGLASALLNSGRYAEAERVADQLPHEHPNWFVIRAAVAARTGNRARAAEILAAMRRQAGDSAHYQYAQMLSEMGDRAGAIAELEAAYEAHDPGLAFLLTDTSLKPLRGDSHFAALISRLRFPQV
jgi:serine/threonine-protein kinase